jgi:hypothetical protein
MLQHLESASAMSELASEPWDEIERQFSEGVRIDALASRFNVSRSRIRRRANKLGWVSNGGDEGEAAAPRERQDRAQRSLKDAATGDASLANQRSAVVERQRMAWVEVYGLRDDAHRILKGQRPKFIKDVVVDDAQERLSLAVRVMAMFEKEIRALTVAQEGERRAYGLSFKPHEEMDAADKAKADRRHELIGSILSRMHRTRFEPADRPDDISEGSLRRQEEGDCQTSGC